MHDDPPNAPVGEPDEPGLLDFALPLVENLKLLVIGPIVAGLLGLGATYLIKPTYTARVALLPPQQQQSAAMSALTSLGALAGLAGNVTNLKSPAEQYVALMRSVSATDRLIDRFDLIKVYGEKYRIDARNELADNVRITVGRKDGLISIEVDDKSPERAAALANAHIDELRRLTDRLAVSEAQQRRAFFESQLQQTRDKLTEAQHLLQASGINAGALKAEPKAAAEEYARLKAQTIAAQVRLEALQRSLAQDTPEVQQQRATLTALRAQLARVEASTDPSTGADYIERYRDFKYQETLFELLARQYEMARADEAREGALIQVVDEATPPEIKSKPKRALVAAATAGATLFVLIGFALLRHAWRQQANDPAIAHKRARLRAALRRSAG